MPSPPSWLALIHPLLAVLVLFPVAGVVVRLGFLVRERRTAYNLALPSTVVAEHWQHGRWLTAAMVVTVWIAELHGLLSHPQRAMEMASPLFWGLAMAGVLLALVAFWQVRGALQRALFCVLVWGGLLALGATPVVERGADHPLQPQFWTSHYWIGVLLVGLMLGTQAVRPELQDQATARELHRRSGSLMLLLFALAAITGLRDLVGLRP